MPQCAAFGCSNFTSNPDQKQPEGLTLHRFPVKRPDILKQWVKNLNRKNFTPNKNSRLCSGHFLPECFEKSKLLQFGISPTEKRRKLTPDAVPSLFVHLRGQEQQQQRMLSVARRAKADRDERTIKLITATPEEPQPSQPLTTRIPTARTEQISGPTSRKKKRVATVTNLSLTPVQEPEPLLVDYAGPKMHHTPELQIVEMESFEATLNVEASAGVTPPQTPVFYMLPSPLESVDQYGTPRRTRLDHPYAVGPSRTSSTQTKKALLPSPIKVVAPEPETPSSPLQPPSESEIEDPEDDLASYLPSSDVTSEDESDPDTQEQNWTSMNKYIIFQENLDQLYRFCNQCGAPTVDKSTFTRGSMIGYHISCHNGHSYVWHSQPQQNKQPLGNLLIAAAILISGNTYAKIYAFASMLKLAILSKSQFNQIQRKNVLPVIQECWGKEKKKAQDEVRDLDSLVLSGDGRCDSPGHTAKYGSYTLMHTKGWGQEASNKIVSLQLVQVSEVKNSVHMEPVGLRRCLEEVKREEIDVAVLATDRHNMVSCMMRKDFKEIDHQYDTWHVAKNVTKKLTAKAATKDCTDLTPWIQSISNHLWWSCATCCEDEQLLREKWISVLHHLVNRHKWSGNVKFLKCDHSDLPRSDEKAIKWLKPKSAAHEALKKVVMETSLLKAMTHLTKFCHTGDLEVFHSMLLKYCPKRQHFHYDAMYGRLMLAAFDWNNTLREQKRDDSGKPLKAVVYSKRRKTFVLRNRYQKLETGHMMKIIQRVEEVNRKHINLPQLYRPELPKNVASVRVSTPSVAQLEEKSSSRFYVKQKLN